MPTFPHNSFLYAQVDDNPVESVAGGKKLFIQDANGQIFYIQCPEGFTVETGLTQGND